MAEGKDICDVWGPHPSLLLGHQTNLSLRLGLLGLCVFMWRNGVSGWGADRATLIVKEQGGLRLRLEEAEESLVTDVLIHGV